MFAYGLDRKEKNFIPNVMFSPFSDDVYRLFFFVLSPSGDLRAGVAFVKFTTGLLPKWMD